MDKKLIHLFLIALSINYVQNLHSQNQFTDITNSAGINHVFKVYDGTFGGGAVAFDIDNDGYEDLFITGGTNKDHLYLNNGDGTFTNIYEISGLNSSSNYVTQGCASADVNRDGYRDLFITTINSNDNNTPIPRAHNLLFLNNGDKTFRNATKEFGIDELNSFSTAPSFGDINADGYPDLYVGNYFQEFKGKLGILKDATIVSSNERAKSYLLLNKGGKKFVDAYENYDLGHKGFGFGAVLTDYDNDSDLDILVNHDFGYKAAPNILYENLYPKKKFRDVSKLKEMDLKINAMGAAVGDYNNDGNLDYYVTNIKFNLLMTNQGFQLPFIDKAKELGTHKFTISWGANFADFDNDGDLDLYVTNGDLNPNCTPMGNFYFENEGKKFLDKSIEKGADDYGIGRGSVVFDIENDGDLDLLVVNQNPILEYPIPSFTRLFRNDGDNGNWLKVKLDGIEAEKNGIGSRVELSIGDFKMIREIDGGGSSHLSQNSVVAHFGLGKSTMKVDTIRIHWLGGKKQVITQIDSNQLIIVTEEKSTNYSPFYWLFVIPLIALTLYFLKLSKAD
ncbi:CRTAC1 family protein [Cytophaga sp. FL35]|uniref:CRTAC1 family protein n=1 Tax=Cytophaga sp. FL35 TaxID=1904456 RepID=UPI001653945E|nr:CRTAC1 family protein [Cytophaga sp. FL35]MBC6997353.1 CRTAC1 family protein [Cytophaga sp. FL35]